MGRFSILFVSFVLSGSLFGSIPKTVIHKDLLVPRTGGVVPPRIDDIVSGLKHAGEFPGGVLLPKGRSLQVDNVDENEPRLVITSIQHNKDLAPTELPQGVTNRTGKLSSFFEGRAFVGFASKNNEREIISMNMETGEFEFMLANPADPDTIKGFIESFQLKPKIETDIMLELADRNVCMECHAHGGPIFPEGPWTEIDMQHPRSKGSDEFAEQILNFHGIPTIGKKVEKGDPSARAFDMAVHVGNRLLQANRMCRNICEGQDKECKRLILMSALAKRDQSPYVRKFVGSVRRDPKGTPPREEADSYLTSVNIPRKIRERMANFSEIWPDDGYEYISHILPDPLNTFNEEKLKPRISVNPREKHDAIGFRQAPAYVYDVSAECLGFRPEDLLVLQKFGRNTIFAFLETEEFESLLNTWPPKPNNVMEKFLEYAKNTTDVETEPLAIERLNAFQRAEKAFIDENNGLNLMRRYCTECHVRGVNTKIPFEGEEDKLLEDWGDEIVAEMENDRMPHQAAKEHILESVVRAHLRNKLLKYLKDKGLDVRETFREGPRL